MVGIRLPPGAVLFLSPALSTGAAPFEGIKHMVVSREPTITIFWNVPDQFDWVL